MVLIISYAGGSVNHVIDWIHSAGIIVHRVNPFLEKVNLRDIELTATTTNIELYLENYAAKTKISDYSGIWIWHGELQFQNCCPLLQSEEQNETTSAVYDSLVQHQKVMIDFVSEYLSNTKKTIGNYKIQNLNKLDVLLKAKTLGITIPNTYIVSQKKRLMDIIEQKKVITKPYHEIIHPKFENWSYGNYTSDVTEHKVKNIGNEIYPSLIQEKIEKKIEIRSFYLNNKFYSMAIFSQDSSKTQLDFRNYNFEKPNRTVPFKIPGPVEKKLKQLFKTLCLNSGSVDLIYTIDHQYVFLEINPVGQFGMVSIPCNYYLEKIIMKTLANG
jgi:ATP-GRASP peptide maturase of grasp-with-spasm system